MTERAELLVTGRIATLAGTDGFGWVDAIAVRAGRVVAAGRPDEVEVLAGPGTRRLALGPDEIALPGLTDAHLHLADAAAEADALDLADPPTLEAGLALVADAHRRLPPGRWLLGRGWRVDRWRRWPSSGDLAAVAPGRAVALWQHDHHALWLSHEALAAAGIGTGTPDPAGGTIVRGDDGRPTGILLEAAVRLAGAVIPAADADRLVETIPRVVRQLLALGVVAVHDPATLVSDPRLAPAYEAYRRLDESGRLPIRVHAGLRAPALAVAREHGLRSGMPLSAADDVHVRVGWLKLFADGTLGSRTAAMLEPFDDADPSAPGGRRGMLVTPAEELAADVERAAGQGIATQIHAIGDAAVRVALGALATTAGRSALQPRVEHVQLVDPSDLPRFAHGGIAASVQPGHLAGDADAARAAWGSRLGAAYPWRSLAASGAHLPFGTDAPVEPLDPWPGLAVAVTRRGGEWGSERETFGPDEALTLERVMRSACLDPALVAGEKDRGRLVAGQRADLIVLPAGVVREPVTPDGPLATARPLLTIVAGRVLSER